MQTVSFNSQNVTNKGASLTNNQYLTANHHIWWECDTGIAYMIAQSDNDGFPVWNESGSKQHIYIFDLHDPHNPVFIREWGLVGQQPGAASSAGYVSCYNDPGGNCYEGFTNPPGGVHQAYSAGLYNVNTNVGYPVNPPVRAIAFAFCRTGRGGGLGRCRPKRRACAFPLWTPWSLRVWQGLEQGAAAGRYFAGCDPCGSWLGLRS